MPSASALEKVDKQNSVESNEPLKQVQILVEKKIRNLEKRKGKLEQLQEEQKSGKALHDDQKKAIKRFDGVLEMLDFFKEFNKNVATIFTEHAKQMKKAAKREQLEKQQQEIEKFKTVILLQDLLNNMGTDDARNDFLKGTNGATALTEQKLTQLDELYKLVIPDRSRTEEPFSKQLENSAERLLWLVEGKNREACEGVTYKELKELLLSIHTCGYFSVEVKSETKEEVELGQSGDVPPAVEAIQNNDGNELATKLSQSLNTVTVETKPESYQVKQLSSSGANDLVGQIGDNQTVSSGYNFLQESRLELEGAPHMDPAVVAMAPASGGGYSSQFANSSMTVQNAEALAVQIASGMQASNSSAQKAVTTYDINSHQPIQTQTFTNQNFAAMMATTAYVPAVTIATPSSMALGLPVQHIPVQNISPHHTTPSPDLMSVQDTNPQQLLNQQIPQQHLSNYQEPTYTYQVENRNEGNQTSQENTQAYNDDNSGYTQSQVQAFNRAGYRNGGRGGARGGRGSAVNGYSRNSAPGRSGPTRGYQGGAGNSFGVNNYTNNSNGPYYGSGDKRALSNASNQYSGRSVQSNRGGARSGGGITANRNTGGTFSNK